MPDVMDFTTETSNFGEIGSIPISGANFFHLNPIFKFFLINNFCLNSSSVC